MEAHFQWKQNAPSQINRRAFKQAQCAPGVYQGRLCLTEVTGFGPKTNATLDNTTESKWHNSRDPKEVAMVGTYTNEV